MQYNSMTKQNKQINGNDPWRSKKDTNVSSSVKRFSYSIIKFKHEVAMRKSQAVE